MSSRALRRLKGKLRGQEALDPGDLKLAEDPEPTAEPGEEEGGEVVLEPAKKSKNRKAKKNKSQKNLSNIYELIGDVETEPEKSPTDDEVGRKPTDHDDEDGKEKGDSGETEKTRTNETVGEQFLSDVTQSESTEKVNKKRKRKKKKKSSDSQEEAVEEDIEALLETMDRTNGLSHHTEGSRGGDSRPVLYVEHRNLNPETELKRYFGARAVLGEQRPRQRQRQFHRSTWMTVPKNTWPRFSKPGMSMALVESRDGLQCFTFEHSRDYQQVQFKFLDAVESMEPNNIVALLQLNPYHIDSLLQLSDVCRIQEDQEMARDLIERALYSFECAFHPVCSLTSGTTRIPYTRQENRPFYLALYKHMVFLEKRGCPRTALEFCKLILSLDPDGDPLCMLLLVDFLSQRSREYHFLIRLYEEWEIHRNLSQLPNFVFSVALCHFHLSQEEECEERERALHRADELLQNALIMFPGVLMPLLELCSVQPDAAVTSHVFFGVQSQIGQSPALRELVCLYVGRSHALWKEGGVLGWLEKNVREVLCRVDSKDPLVEDCKNKRTQRYRSAPRNIHRHVLLSEIKEATSTLPLEVTTQPVMAFDPLPPLDSIGGYARPERQRNQGAANENSLSLFFRSLLPNFNLQGAQRPEDDLEVARAGRELNQEVNRLMVAMRDMLANIQFQEPLQDANPDRDEEEWD